MSEIDKPLPVNPSIISLQGQILALRNALAVLIEILPDDQQAVVLGTLKSQATAANYYNGASGAFPVEEEAAHQMHNMFSTIPDLVEHFRAMRLTSRPT